MAANSRPCNALTQGNDVRIPWHSQAHPVIPKLYVQEWRQDMRNRELINTNAAIGMIPNHEHDDSLYLDRREQLVYNVEERARVDSKYEVPPREAMMKPPNHSSHSRYKSSLVTLSK
ncbi:hypothetical protein BOX15_Mlig010259g3 [Macrostomum lignano]|uniref:Uncharacterized protein n=1 Tax=Macrostomum lignano TaxID=282301 RepID=A0A267FT55_9PLAT|nr:hypothetical protein BOX15_Mlig010259g3 [Macrostomum lignano]